MAHTLLSSRHLSPPCFQPIIIIIIINRIGKFKGADPPNKSKVFAKLIMEGQINAALRFLNESTSGGVLSLTDDVMKQLKEKHPDPQSAKLGSI